MIHHLFSKNSERGRSLIELIAILVIMAILLIAALVGFRALLDYLKKKQTVEQIGAIGMRYKVDRLDKKCKDPNGCKVTAKQFYPEGDPCDREPAVCVKTRDGGEIRVFSSEQTDTFVVIASQISPQSCAEAVLQEGYSFVKRYEGTETNGNTFINDITAKKLERLAGGAKKALTTGNYLRLEDFKNNLEAIMDYCCYDDGDTKKYPNGCTFGFIYMSEAASNDACKNLCGGRCHECENCDHKKDSNGDCCDPDDMDCGVCGGCKGGDVCFKDNCAECDPDTNDSDGTNSKCKGRYHGQKDYCDNKGRCNPCKEIGGKCSGTSGSSRALYCPTDPAICIDPDCPTPPCCPPDVCPTDCRGNQCCVYDEDNFKYIIKYNYKKLNETCSGTCDRCESDDLTCTSGKCQCVSACSDPDKAKLAEGEKCDTSCNCCASGLTCVNGICTEKQYCTKDDGYKEDQNDRKKGEKCSTQCPCADTKFNGNSLFQCLAGKCECTVNLPTTKGGSCHPECGCAENSGLECKGSVGSATCQCKDLGGDKGDGCAQCPCSDQTVSETDKRPLLICYNETNKTKVEELFRWTEVVNNKWENTCQCNPEIEKHSLPAGSNCVEDCDQCQLGLACNNGICGCTKDEDCASDCDGKTKCDTTNHVCVCDTDLGLVNGGDGKCYCADKGKADKSQEFWRIPSTQAAGEKPTEYMCCPANQVPYLVNGEYECRPICTDGQKAINNLALVLDYSNSTVFNGYDSKIRSAANTILSRVKALNPNIEIGVFREDNTHSTTDTTGTGQSCKGNKNNIIIQDFGKGSPDLNQDTCAFKCQGKGMTCFTGVQDKVSKKCKDGDTLTFIISDGIIPANSATAMGCGNRTYAFASDSVNLGLELGHQLNYESSLKVEDILSWLEQVIGNTMCVDPAEAETITSSWICKS